MCPRRSLLLILLVAVTVTTVCCHSVLTNEQLTHENARLDKKVETLEEERVKLTLGLEQLKERLTEKMDSLWRKLDSLVTDKARHVEGAVNGRYQTEPKPKSCVEVMKFDTASGVHTLNVNGYDNTAYCDQTTNGGGWTVIQRRETGDIDFYREWDAYLRGFGNPGFEHWLGLENIHQMTKTRNYKLRVDLTAFDGTTAYAEYDQFYVDAADQKYTLHVRGYSGTAGDSLGYHNTRPFSTYDRGNGNNCAVDFHGAWWYNGCHWSNLNGLYRQSAIADSYGIDWRAWKNAHTSLKKVEMKVKPSV